MADSKYDILHEVLPAIDPARLDYKQWINVGFALKDGGYSAADWEAWSARDARRYHPGECEQKWRTIQSEGVTLGTLIQYAREQGWTPPRQPREDRALDWDDVIGGIIDAPEQLEAHPLPALYPDWHPGKELTHYLELLFSPDEIVGYVTEVWYNEDKGKYMPSRGNYTRTAGDLIADIAKHGDDLGAAIGDTKREAGAWIRFNPLDGQGIRNENVTEYRYALVESDAMPVEQQLAVYQALELPARVLVHSGGKSLHAIVHIGAGSYDEYKKRVAYLYKVCETNGLKVDGQNKNPSRLSRMPGIMRGEHRQYIVAENIGKASFEEWQEWIEAQHDELPDPQNLADVWDNLPPLAPPLIEGVLRQGHKMLLAGPSKAGKSFALLELCIAIAEGGRWLGFQCAQGRVLYVNLELDASSCWHRIRDVYQAMGVEPRSRANIDVWNLRGSAVPMDKFAPKLIRRAQKKGYLAVVIDPIYKVITGDENSADQMAKFCNQFDLICNRLQCAVIYCHHHSKGLQGQKRSMDRASGSGVFARDPDAMLDMIELPVVETLRKSEGDRAVREICRQALSKALPDTWEEYVTQDDSCSHTRMEAICAERLKPWQRDTLRIEIEAARARADALTAWRMEGALREFAALKAVNFWFDYPAHRLDDIGALKDTQPESEQSWWDRGRQKRAKAIQKQKNRLQIDMGNAVDLNGGAVSVAALAETLEKSVKDGKVERYQATTIAGWFNEKSKSHPELREDFEAFIGEDARAWIRRKEATNDEDCSQ